MAVKLSETDLPELLAWLEPHRPECYKVYGELKSHLKGLIPDLQFFVDRWPHPQALVARENPAGGQTNSMTGEIIVFGLDDKGLDSVLKDPSVVAWDKPITFSILSEKLSPAVQAIAAEKGKSVTVQAALLLKATPRELKPIPIPEGLKVQPITDAEIKIIHSTWGLSYLAKESYVQNYVEKYPSIYVVTENGDHVGHMVGSSYGVMGMLYVNPQFRGKGYGKVIVSQLSQKYFDLGEDAYVTVQDDVNCSLALHRSLGFQETSETKSLLVLCD